MLDDVTKAKMRARIDFLRGSDANGNIYNSSLNSTRKIVLWAIDTYIGRNPDEVCWPSQAELMRATCLAECTLNRVLAYLETNSYIARGRFQGHNHAIKWLVATVPQTAPTVPQTGTVARTGTVPQTAPTVPQTAPTVPQTAPTVPQTVHKESSLSLKKLQESTTSENVDDVNHDEESLIDYWEEREAPLSESCDITTQSEPYDITVEKLSEANSLSDLSGANLPTPKAPAPPPAAGLTWGEAVALKSAQRKAAKSAKSVKSNTAELERLAQMLQDRWPAQALHAGMPAIRPAVRRAWTQSHLSLSAFAHDLPERLTAALAAWATWTDAQIPSQVDWLANGKWANPIKSFKSTTATSSASEARSY